MSKKKTNNQQLSLEISQFEKLENEVTKVSAYFEEIVKPPTKLFIMAKPKRKRKTK